MALTPYVCTNCGFWQRHFAPPRGCPVCEDVRHTPPEDGYHFASADEIAASIECTWTEIEGDVLMFGNTPALGIGPSGYLIRHDAGNIFFESVGFYTPEAIDQIAAWGGIRWLAASHPHAYGANWQLQQRFQPDVVIHRADLPWTNMLNVSWPCDESLELASGVHLLHTGGHFDGHMVLYHGPRRTLFAGDALKFEIKKGRAVGISCHKGFNRQIPLSHAEIRHYREVIGSLDFDQVFTSFEHAPNVSPADVRALFDAQLAGRPFCTPLPLVDRA